MYMFERVATKLLRRPLLTATQSVPGRPVIKLKQPTPPPPTPPPGRPVVTLISQGRRGCSGVSGHHHCCSCQFSYRPYLVCQGGRGLAAAMSSYPFFANYDKRGMAKCKSCKEKCEKGALRLGKVTNNPFSSGGETMKIWYHTDCLFSSFKKARATTKKIDNPEEDIENWDQVEDEDKKKIEDLLEDLRDTLDKKAANTPKKQTPKKQNPNAPTLITTPKPSPGGKASRPPDPPATDRTHKDNSFREFRRLCAAIADEPSYLTKTQLVADLFTKGTEKDKFQGDLRLWVRLLLPGEVKRVYNLQSKQLLKLFSQIFSCSLEEMMEDLEQGDVAETVRKFFESSRQLAPVKKSKLSLQDVDEMLEELSGKTREEDQTMTLRAIAKKCTSNDLKMVVRLIKGDLRINAGAKHILSGVHADAYEAFQTTRDIDAVLEKVITGNTSDLKMSATVLTPVRPMLAEACKSVEYAFKKCPSGVMYAEVKYDGERVQLHKQGTDFKFFSRSLKPVMPHKVEHFKQHIPTAFPGASNLILDAEVLMICTKTGHLLPFGTLGIHKKAAFKDACPCLFVFDCLHYNGEDLMSKTLQERRAIMEKTMVEVKNHVMFSEMSRITRPEDLRDMIARVLRQGLEGLVLKDIKSIYEPGKRHWLKVKKDYLNDGAMADSADLVVLGAWYGTGKKGGMMSVFLMGCHDERINKWCTVTKVHTGHDDASLERLQTQLNMVKISQDYARCPPWLKVNKQLIPDFVAADPKRSPVWEISGAEFTRHQVHTADGISIRFPRVTKERHDKDWTTATSLAELQTLYKNSKDYINIDTLLPGDGGDNGDDGGDNGSMTPKTSTSASSSPQKKVGREDRKRKENSQQNKKRRKEDEEGEGGSGDEVEEVKKMCKRAENCQNNNEAHRLLFEHPQASTSSKTTSSPASKTTPSSSSSSTPSKLRHSTSPNSSSSFTSSSNIKRDGTTAAATASHSTKDSVSRPTTTTTTPPTAAATKKDKLQLSPAPTCNPLPDVFLGTAVTLPKGVKERELLARYVVAYGGEVLPDYKHSEATHIIVPTQDTRDGKRKAGEEEEDRKGKGKREGVTVGERWVWDSIKLQRLMPTHHYRA